MLMSMIIPELRAQGDAAMLLVEDADLDYSSLKRFVAEYIYRQLPPSNGGSGRDAYADGLENDDHNNEQMDAFAKGPRRYAKRGGKEHLRVEEVQDNRMTTGGKNQRERNAAAERLDNTDHCFRNWFVHEGC